MEIWRRTMTVLGVVLLTLPACVAVKQPSPSGISSGVKGGRQAQATTPSPIKLRRVRTKNVQQRIWKRRSVLLRGVPHVHQKPDFCGEACVAMFMKKLGYKAGQDQVFNKAGISPLKARGAITVDMVRVLKRIGFQPGPVWRWISVQRHQEEMGREWDAMMSDLEQGIPSIVCMHYDGQARTTEHFRLVLGYDAKKDTLIYHEPAEKKGSYLQMKREIFLKLWPLKYEKQRWLLIRMRLKGKKLNWKPQVSAGFTPADYAQHIMALKKKLPRGFSMVLEPPFVVVGDEDIFTIRQRAKSTVRWATRRLKALYFSKDPKHILTVWLFKDKQSYIKHNWALFREKPDTPYGYYSSGHRALIMNIATGGGTLVHEIVHPFIESNFPGCPAWLNEGLGSLYEQCGERKGRIHGYLNWRLPGIQQAIRAGKSPSFKKLLGTTETQFYADEEGVHYAQARYLCYYLQQKGLLVKFYHAFFKARRRDPSGYKTLQKILKVKDMNAFHKRWSAWVLKLKRRD